MKFSVYSFTANKDYINGDTKEIYCLLSEKFPEENLINGDIKFTVKDVLYKNNKFLLIKVYENYSDRRSGVKEKGRIIDHDDFIRSKNGIPLLIRFILIDKEKMLVYKNSDCKQKTMYSLLNFLMDVEAKSVNPVVDLDDIAFFDKIKIEEFTQERINLFNNSQGFETIEDLGVEVQDIDRLEFTLLTNKLIPTNKDVIDKIMLRSNLLSITGQNKDGKMRSFDNRFQQSIDIVLKYSKATGLDKVELKEIMELLYNEI